MTFSAGGILSQLAKVYELPAGAGRIRAMEGLRGCAALLVFWTHYHAFFHAYAPAWLSGVSYRMHLAGNAGVDLFFVLSGFLIYGMLLEKRTPYRRFLWRRVVRLWPAFLAVFLLYVALALLLPERSKLPRDPADAAGYLLANLLLLPGFFDIKPLVLVSWSLSYEVVFYTLLPLAVTALGARRMPARRRVAVIVLLAAGYWAFCYVYGSYFNAAIRLAPGAHPRMILFAGGMLVREAWAAGRWPRGSVYPGALGVLGLLIFSLLLDPPGALAEIAPRTHHLRYCWGALALALTFPWFTAAVLSGEGALAAVFLTRPLRWLGNISYSFYLLHGLTINALGQVFPRLLPPPAGGSLALFCLGACVALAAAAATTTALFWAVERPLSLVRRPAAHAIMKFVFHRSE